MALRTTAILNLKGGVAKTTTAVNMAAILAKIYGKRILLIDADSQCNTTHFFGVDPKNGSIADLLRDGSRLAAIKKTGKPLIYPTRYKNIDILPADDTLMDLDLSTVKHQEVQVDVLRRLLNAVSSEYDFCFIDCPPAFNAACASALVAADDVVIPIKLDAFSIQGMGNLTRQILNMRKINSRLKLSGVLPTMWYPSEENDDAMQHLEKFRFKVFCPIRLSKPAERMTWKQSPIIECSPRSGAAIDYKMFVAEYLAGGVF